MIKKEIPSNDQQILEQLNINPDTMICDTDDFWDNLEKEALEQAAISKAADLQGREEVKIHDSVVKGSVVIKKEIPSNVQQILEQLKTDPDTMMGDTDEFWDELEKKSFGTGCKVESSRCSCCGGS